MGKTKSKKPKAKPTAPEPAAVGPVPSAPTHRSISSPFYPAIGLPEAVQPPPKPTAEAPEPSLAFRETMKPPKDHRKAKMAASWSAKAAAVLVPALLSGLGSYQSSKSDSESGYKATLAAVDELQEATKELVKQQAYMQGELDALRRDGIRSGSSYKRRAEPPSDLKSKVVLSALPTDLGSAIKSKGKLNEQQVIELPNAAMIDAEDRAVFAEAEKKRAEAIAEMEKKRATAATQMGKKREKAAAALEKEVPMIVAPAPPPPKIDDPAPAAPPE